MVGHKERYLVQALESPSVQLNHLASQISEFLQVQLAIVLYGELSFL